jgi:hypothetical protein
MTLPLPTPQDSITLGAIAERLEDAEAAGVPRSSLMGIRAVVRQAADRLIDTRAFVTTIEANDRLSDIGKREQTSEMRALTREIVQGITEDVRARVERTTAPKDLEPPVSDPLVLEAKLQSARHDAELALRNERHGPAQDLMALAEGGDPIVR